MGNFKNAWLTRVGAAMVILYTFAGFKSCEQIRYSMSGKSATATISDISQEKDRFGQVVGYKLGYWVPNDNTHSDSRGFTMIDVEAAPQYHLGQRIDVDYVGDDYVSFSSRLKGTHSYGWLAVFLSFPAMLLGLIVWGIVQARLTSGKPKPKRR